MEVVEEDMGVIVNNSVCINLSVSQEHTIASNCDNCDYFQEAAVVEREEAVAVEREVVVVVAAEVVRTIKL